LLALERLQQALHCVNYSEKRLALCSEGSSDWFSMRGIKDSPGLVSPNTFFCEFTYSRLLT